MPDIRYQVFVSSTFSDLAEERVAVQKLLLKMHCFPAGMELFPASDRSQLDFIARVIDDSDYYVVIVAGRYGSVTEDGISFTEKEFDYAVAKGIPVLAFLHADPEQLPIKRSELDPAIRERLRAFREKVRKNRVVSLWETTPDLTQAIMLSLRDAIESHPRPGWTRGDISKSRSALRLGDDSQPRLMLRQPGALHVETIHFGTPPDHLRAPTGWLADLLKVRFVNDPKSVGPNATAPALVAKCAVSQGNNVILTFDGRWSESDQPGELLMRRQSITHLLRMDFGVGDERSVDLVMKRREETDCFVFNNDNYLAQPTLQFERHRLPPGVYQIDIRLRGINVDETFAVSFRNAGASQAIEILA